MQYSNDKWLDFFSNRYFNFFNRAIILRELFSAIRQFAVPPAGILELGCGSGITALVLASMGYRVTAIDILPQIVGFLKKFEDVFPNISFSQMDMFSLEFANEEFDLAFSQGVLEHYNEADIVRAISEQRRVARIGIFDVPNGRGKLGDIGDERKIRDNEWRLLIRRSGC